MIPRLSPATLRPRSFLPRSLWQVAVILPLLLVGCGDRNARYLIAPPAPGAEVRLRVGSIEVRDVGLPTYAAAVEILLEAPDGALRPIRRAVWADEPTPGITAAIARRLDERTTAIVSPEPWPLPDPAQMRVEVRLDRLVARADGQMQLSGQIALIGNDGFGRIERFDIAAPRADDSAAAIATATGAALDRLAGQIITRLR